jgi:hypothetical protein
MVSFQVGKLMPPAPSRPERAKAINSLQHFDGFVPTYKIPNALTGAKKINVLKVNSFFVSFLFVSSKFQFRKI